jgi:hypothetical protein
MLLGRILGLSEGTEDMADEPGAHDLKLDVSALVFGLSHCSELELLKLPVTGCNVPCSSHLS